MSFMSTNVLLLNSDLTEVVVFGSKFFRNRLSSRSVTLDGITEASRRTVRKYGVSF